MTGRALALWALMPIALAAQQRDAAAPPPVAGTGEIAGVVVTADANAQPLRRAVVTITGDVRVPRSVLTDDHGAFVSRALPVGSFLVTARKAAYLAAPYGARRPGRAGTPIALAAAQHVSVTVTMFKGAAISGTLRDAAGQPLPGIDVRAVDARVLNLPPDGPSQPSLATSDDRGMFRIYGLLPGDYVIAALPTSNGPEITVPSSADLDRMLAALDARGRMGGVVSAPPPAQEPQPRATGYAPVFFPGTPNSADATRITVGAGEEREGIDLRVTPWPFASIDGIVSGAANLAAAEVTIIPSGPRVVTSYNSSNLSGKPIDDQGRFRYSNLAPGHYRLVARLAGKPMGMESPIGLPTVMNGRVSTPVASSGTSTPTPPGDALFASVDVDLNGENVSALSLMLEPGATLSGRVVFHGSSSAPPDLTKVRVVLSGPDGGWRTSSDGLIMGPAFAGGSSALVKPDGTFEVRGIPPGRFTLTCTLPTDVKGWSLRSAIATGRDLLDEPVDARPAMDLRDVIVTFSDTPAALSGTLQLPSGQPATAYSVVALPQNRALWQPKARRILTTRPSTEGQFAFRDLPAGAYLLSALTDLDPIDLMDPAFLSQIAAAGIPVTVADGEKKVQDLRIK